MLIWDAHFRTGKGDEVVVNYSGWYGLGPKDFTAESTQTHPADSIMSFYKRSG
jgi:hypothetical protein